MKTRTIATKLNRLLRLPLLTLVLALIAGCGSVVQDPTNDGYGAGKGDNAALELSTKDFFLGALATGSMPKGAEISHDGRWLYVSNMGEATVSAVDLSALAEWRQRSGARYFASSARQRDAIGSWLQQIGAGLGAEAVALVDDARVLTKIDTPYGYEGHVVGNIEIAYLEGTELVLTTELERKVLGGGGQVTLIDSATKQVVGEIPTGGTGSKVMALAPNADASGRHVLYVSNWFSNDISVIDVSAERIAGVTAAYTPGTRSPGLRVKRIGLVTDHPSNKSFPIAPRGIAFSADGRYAVVSAFNAKTMFVIETRTHQQVAELAPLPDSIGRASMRHVVVSDDGHLAYVSLLASDRVIRIDLPQLLGVIDELRAGGSHRALSRRRTGKDSQQVAMLSSAIWDEILVPWAGGVQALSVKRFSADHSRPASFRDVDSGRADPNTIVLDPRPGNRYLYVSCRNTKGWPPSDGRYDWDGKIDVVDTRAGRVIFTLVGGPEPTGLTISPDGRTLVSTDFRGARARFYDVGALTDEYQRRHRVSR